MEKKHTKFYDRPAVIHKYFSNIGHVDHHNMARQGILRLEKKWLTKCPYYRFWCSILGMCLIDGWLGYKFAIEGGPNKDKVVKSRRHKHYGISVKEFCELVATAILQRYGSGSIPSTAAIHQEGDENNNENEHGDDDDVVVVCQPVRQDPEVQSLSSAEDLPRLHPNRRHTMARYGVGTTGAQIRNRCRWCILFDNKTERRTAHYCVQCDAAFCVPSTRCGRDCFILHIRHHHEWKEADARKRNGGRVTKRSRPEFEN